MFSRVDSERSDNHQEKYKVGYLHWWNIVYYILIKKYVRTKHRIFLQKNNPGITVKFR